MNTLLNKLIFTLFSHLAKAAENESKTHAGSRTIVYSRAALRLYFIGAVIGALVFTAAIASELEPKRAGLAGFLGLILLLPLALAGAELLLTRITFDDVYIHTSSPWHRRRRIPWTAVTECVVAEGEYYITLRTQGYGPIKLNFFMRGVGDVIEQTALRAFTHEEDTAQDGIFQPTAPTLTVVKRKDHLGMILGSMFILIGVVGMILSATMVTPEASAYTTIDGEVINHQRTIDKTSERSFFWLREPTRGPLRPDLARPQMHFIIGGRIESFPEHDYLQSLHKGALITLTVLAEDADKIKKNGTSMESPVRAVALRVGTIEYYSLTQYLEASRHDRFMFLICGAGFVVLGIVIWFLLSRKGRQT